MAVKTAVIGLGIMGQRMVAQMQANPGYQVVAGWDPSAQACAQAQAAAPGLAIADSAEQAMADAQLVYLACPPVPRKHYALQAAAAGRAVFLEKPLGVDVAESRDLVASLAASGVPAAVNFTQAASPALTRTRMAAQQGQLGALAGVDIVVSYAQWPRLWQQGADWLRFRAEGGMTREVISHFLFVAQRILGPLRVVQACPSYPTQPDLCESHMLARLENADGLPVSVFASVGGAQPDRQELVIKGQAESRRITDFYADWASTGAAFSPLELPAGDPRSDALQAQLGDLLLCLQGKPHRLATPDEALHVQILIETMLAGGAQPA